jgi:hypothetical protein
LFLQRPEKSDELVAGFRVFFKKFLSQFQTHLSAFFQAATEGLWIRVLHFLSTLLGLNILTLGESIFDSNICLYRGTQVSDQGFTALGSSIKDLNNLTNLSLNFELFLINYFSQFQTHLRSFSGFFLKPLNLSFEFLINPFGTSPFTQRSFHL